MCNLNLYLKTNKFNKNVDSEKLLFFVSLSTYESYKNNKDGEGFYISNGELIKTKNKINPLFYKDSIIKTNMLLTHQRLSTSGFNDLNIQPLESKDFILLHNGVISNYSDDELKSDSYIFLDKFNKSFEILQKENNLKNIIKQRESNIIKVIKNLCETEIKGYYSICIKDKSTNSLYYFKDEKTNINFISTIDKSFLYITTKKDNIDLFNKFYNNNISYEIDDYVIYKIKVNKNQIVFNKLSDIIKPKSEISFSYWNYKDDWDIYTKKKKNKVKMKVIRQELGFKHSEKIKHKCCYCNSKATNESFSRDVYSKYLCDYCLREEYKYYNSISKNVDY